VIEGEASYSLKIDQFFLKEILSVDLNQETPIPFLVLELKLLEIIERSKKPKDPTQSKEDDSDSKKKIQKTELKIELKTEGVEPEKKVETVEPSQVIKKIEPVILDSELDTKTLWQNLIKSFATDNFSLLTLLKSCKLDSLSDGIARVFVYYSFHKEQLEQNKNRDLLSKAAMELLGINLRFDFVLQSETAFVEATSETQDSELMLAAKDSLL
jgi:hypothetical protein